MVNLENGEFAEVDEGDEIDSSWCGIGGASFKSRVTAEVLVIHIHGGGFVAMSSGSHQNYTRVWSNDLKLPIFSIDYKLAPQYAFPEALNDCWQAYYWLVLNAEKQLGIKPKAVILSGDSAGANLCLAVSLMAI